MSRENQGIHSYVWSHFMTRKRHTTPPTTRLRPLPHEEGVCEAMPLNCGLRVCWPFIYMKECRNMDTMYMIHYLKSQLSTPGFYARVAITYTSHPIYFCESLIDKHNHHHKTSKYYVQIGSRISAGDTLRGGLVDCCKLFTVHESIFFLNVCCIVRHLTFPTLTLSSCKLSHPSRGQFLYRTHSYYLYSSLGNS